ncbi:hypothetical protein PR202_gb28673 [Eleusine coracana subsp. coracana]|uniref:Uncharacterized protein n=1 Tax=Eleusine coracana subsp. coracana TaxID=191504 RepID=A0AAV5FXL7_ELECO|nr:hypothetical protein PR202_gb28673 [Eleusine coracana subsp. coracana]
MTSYLDLCARSFPPRHVKPGFRLFFLDAGDNPSISSSWHGPPLFNYSFGKAPWFTAHHLGSPRLGFAHSCAGNATAAAVGRLGSARPRLPALPRALG